MSSPIVVIDSHTTSSFPRPHILYNITINHEGQQLRLSKRYSEFEALHNALGVTYLALPPKRILSTAFMPSAWIDDSLIEERKSGLASYLVHVLDSEYKDAPALLEFLQPTPTARNQVTFNAEDALPSTLTRKAALAMKNSDVRAAATPLAAAYYPSWSSSTFAPENLDYSKFDVIFFAFATPNSASTLDWDSNGQGLLRRLVNSARSSSASSQVVLSVGGWGGSYWFSQATSGGNLSTFTNALVSAVNDYDLDGLDIDWEYPNSNGAGNPHGPEDAANLLRLFVALRSALGDSKIISAAVPHLPWIGANGSPLRDVSAYAEQMTYVNIMNYDVWGASSTPGPNAPLGNLCGTSTQPQASAQAAFNQWTAAGFPASKLLLGLPLYGYVSQSTATSLSGSLMPPEDAKLILENGPEQVEGKETFLNGAHPRTSTSDTVRATADLRSWYGQQIPFSSIVASGALVKSGNTYNQGGGFTKGWDDCSDTPYLFNVSQSTVVTYDDTDSLASKAQFARANGMAGAFTWSLDQDDGTALQDAIRSNLGL